jgi:lipopolysaccharide/colanic/teichoic acid biosynthesis glycosyltransferase
MKSREGGVIAGIQLYFGPIDPNLVGEGYMRHFSLYLGNCNGKSLLSFSNCGNAASQCEAKVVYKQFYPATQSIQHYDVAAEADMTSPPRTRSAQELMIRGLDIAVSLLALLWLAPLLIAVALLVKSSDGGKIFFSQKRIGRGGELFSCFKFRTMVMDAEARLVELLANDAEARAEWDRDHKLRQDPRIIPFGSFLRKWSIDELPQLINVLRGEMSIVGPRPIVPGEACRYGRYILSYQKTRPGLTGLWQISGRNDVSYRRRVACDVVYSRRKSFTNNVRIIFMTAVVVLTARGSY